MKKRILAAFLTLCMIVGLMPTVALANNVSEGGSTVTQRTTTLDLTQDSVSYGDSGTFNPGEAGVTLSDTGEGWAWDHTTTTLTLSGLNLSVTEGNGIVVPAGTTIELAEGSENTINNTADSDYTDGKITAGRGIVPYGNLTVKSADANNKGTLSITAHKSSGINIWVDTMATEDVLWAFENVVLNITACYGIGMSYHNTTWTDTRNVTLSMTGTNYTFRPVGKTSDANGPGRSINLWSMKGRVDLEVEESTIINGSYILLIAYDGVSAKIANSSVACEYICASNNKKALGTDDALFLIDIEDSYVEAINQIGQTALDAYALNQGNAKVNINNSTVIAQSKSGRGISAWGKYAEVNITSSTVSAATGVTEDSVESYAILARSESTGADAYASITIKGSTVSSIGMTRGAINTWTKDKAKSQTITIEDSKIQAVSYLDSRYGNSDTLISGNKDVYEVSYSYTDSTVSSVSLNSTPSTSTINFTGSTYKIDENAKITTVVYGETNEPVSTTSTTVGSSGGTLTLAGVTEKTAAAGLTNGNIELTDNVAVTVKDTDGEEVGTYTVTGSSTVSLTGDVTATGSITGGSDDNAFSATCGTITSTGELKPTDNQITVSKTTYTLSKQSTVTADGSVTVPAGASTPSSDSDSSGVTVPDTVASVSVPVSELKNVSSESSSTSTVSLPSGTVISTTDGTQVTLNEGGTIDSEGLVTATGAVSVTSTGGVTTITPAQVEDEQTTTPVTIQTSAVKTTATSVNVPTGSTISVGKTDATIPAGTSVSLSAEALGKVTTEGENGEATVSLPAGSTVKTDNAIVELTGTTGTVSIASDGTITSTGTVAVTTVADDSSSETKTATIKPTGVNSSVTISTETSDNTSEMTVNVAIQGAASVTTNEGDKTILKNGGTLNLAKQTVATNDEESSTKVTESGDTVKVITTTGTTKVEAAVTGDGACVDADTGVISGTGTVTIATTTTTGSEKAEQATVTVTPVADKTVTAEVNKDGSVTISNGTVGGVTATENTGTVTVSTDSQGNQTTTITGTVTVAASNEADAPTIAVTAEDKTTTTVTIAENSITTGGTVTITGDSDSVAYTPVGEGTELTYNSGSGSVSSNGNLQVTIGAADSEDSVVVNAVPASGTTATVTATNNTVTVTGGALTLMDDQSKTAVTFEADGAVTVTVDPVTGALTAGEGTSVNGRTAETGETIVAIQNADGGFELVTIEAHSHNDDVTWTAWTSATALPTMAGNYYLTCNVTLNGTWAPVNGTSLCLNGKTITQNGTGRVISVGSSVTFTMTDCQNTGAVTGGNAVNGGGVYVDGTFNLYGGSITGNQATGNGGGVYVSSSGVLALPGRDSAKIVTISNNTAENGGGLYYAGPGNVEARHIKITGNSATGNGGGILLDSTAEFRVLGGCIVQGNSATGNGGGLANLKSTWAAVNGGKLYDNTAGTAGDDVWQTTGNTKVALAAPASGLTMSNGAPITGWYSDAEDARWSADKAGEPLTNIVSGGLYPATGSVALKAAYDGTQTIFTIIEVSMANLSTAYDGNTHTITATAAGGNASLPNDLVYKYKVKDADDSTYTSDAPTAAGTYIVKVTSGSSAHALSGTTEAELTIRPVSISTAATSVGAATYPYTGDEITPDVAVTLNSKTLVKDTDYTVAYADNKNAGEATITITGTGNYKDTATCTFTIQKATYDMNGVSFANASHTYDGSEKTLTISGDLPQGVTVQYSNNTLTEVGSTTATATFTGDATNYETIDSKTATLTITKATPTLTLNADKDSLYGGGTVTLTAGGVPGAGTATVTCEGLNITNNGDGTYTATLPNRTATYTFTLNYAESTNYQAATAECQVSVTAYYTPTTTPSTGTTDTTDTVTNEDGSTTVTETAADGTVTVTETAVDGSTTVTETATDGTVTVTDTAVDGAVTVTETATDGTVTVTDTAVNGVETVTVADPKNNVSATVTLPEDVEQAVVVIPASDLTAGTVAVNAETGEVLKLSAATAEGLAILVDSSIQVILTDAAKDFEDVSERHWGAEDIAYTTAHQLFAGISDTAFAPEIAMTRQMAMTVLARLDGQNTDSGATWYAVGTDWAVEQGISDGSGGTESITREQLVTMLYRYAGEPEVAGTMSSFSDAASVSSWAEKAMTWAVSQGIIQGSDGKLDPQASATRVQVAAILRRYCQGLVQ